MFSFRRHLSTPYLPIFDLLLDKISLNKSTGPDRIQPHLPKTLAPEVAEPLEFVFSLFAELIVILNDLIPVTVIIVLKKGQKANFQFRDYWA